MKHRLFPLFLLAALSLTACGTKSYSPSDYIMTLDYKSDFKILQLSDTHIGDKDDQDKQYEFLDLLIKDANKDSKVNLIVVTGDLFTFASKSTAKRFFKFLDSYDTPWTVVFGNHDEQTYFSVDWMTNYLNNFGSNCYFRDIQDDDVAGNCNFAINLMDGSNVHDQLIFMDSNRYYFNDYMGYDYFKNNQIDWYESLTDYSKDSGGYINSLMFYHIPLPEINDAYEKGEIKYGEKREKSCPPDHDEGFFNSIKSHGTKAMFFGHDHINNFEALYEGVTFCYGIKSTDRLYHDDDMLGCQTIKIKDDHSLEIKRLYHTYSEVK